MDEHTSGGDRFGGVSAPAMRMKVFMSRRLAGLNSEQSLPDDYWATRMEEYRRRLASLADDVATLGDTSDTSTV
jgi:hypothetical protein